MADDNMTGMDGGCGDRRCARCHGWSSAQAEQKASIWAYTLRRLRRHVHGRGCREVGIQHGAGVRHLRANTRTISTPQLEHRVLDALRHRLLQPDLVREFVAEYHATREEMRRKQAGERALIEHARNKISGRIGRLTDMMADDIGNYEEIKGRLKAALAERDDVDRRLEAVEVAPAVARAMLENG